jgi:hypothetical protein
VHYLILSERNDLLTAVGCVLGHLTAFIFPDEESSDPSDHPGTPHQLFTHTFLMSRCTPRECREVLQINAI